MVYPLSPAKEAYRSVVHLPPVPKWSLCAERVRLAEKCYGSVAIG